MPTTGQAYGQGVFLGRDQHEFGHVGTKAAARTDAKGRGTLSFYDAAALTAAPTTCR